MYVVLRLFLVVIVSFVARYDTWAL